MSYVESEFIDLIGGEVLMHVFAGGDSEYADAGEFLFTLVTTDEFDPWQPIPGDVTGDGSVTQDDIDIILANWGLQGDDLTSFDGDLNGDGVVDGDDLLIAMEHLGARQFDIEWNPGGQPIAAASGGAETPTWRLVPGYSTPGCGVPEGLCCICCGGKCGCCDEPPNGGDPCDDDPCDPDCEERWCNSECDDGSSLPPLGECHPDGNKWRQARTPRHHPPRTRHRRTPVPGRSHPYRLACVIR